MQCCIILDNTDCGNSYQKGDLNLTVFSAALNVTYLGTIATAIPTTLANCLRTWKGTTGKVTRTRKSDMVIKLVCEVKHRQTFCHPYMPSNPLKRVLHPTAGKILNWLS